MDKDIIVLCGIAVILCAVILRYMFWLDKKSACQTGYSKEEMREFAAYVLTVRGIGGKVTKKVFNDWEKSRYDKDVSGSLLGTRWNGAVW